MLSEHVEGFHTITILFSTENQVVSVLWKSHDEILELCQGWPYA